MSTEKSTILVTEDDREIRSLLSDLLSPEYNVISAQNGEEALELIEHFEPDELDLVLLDVMMPKMDGHQLLKRLRDNFRTENIPVIFLTALNEDEQKIQALEEGAIDYITKPFNTDLLLLKIKNHIQQKHHQDRLYQMSIIDVVTNLYNRRYFEIRLEQEWNRCMRSEGELALLMIDIDYFKRYNDTYGHTAGDSCLAKVANEIQTVFLRASDFVARYGGEEFVVLLPETDLNGAIKLANQVLLQVEALAIPNTGSTICDHVTVSVGAASLLPNHDSSAKQMISMADEQLYKAKGSGRNCAMPSRILSKVTWSDHFSVGHPVMDSHHQKLLGYLNELIEEISKEASSLVSNMQDSQTLTLLAKIHSFAEMHFESEEALLESIGYGSLKEHKLSHESYHRQLSSFNVQERSPEILYQLVALLRD